MNAVSGLMVMVTATWLLLLVETFVLFGVIRPMAPNIHESAFSAVLKVGATIGLGIVWVVVMFFLRTAFVRRVANAPSAHPRAQVEAEPSS